MGMATGKGCGKMNKELLLEHLTVQRTMARVDLKTGDISEEYFKGYEVALAALSYLIVKGHFEKKESE